MRGAPRSKDGSNTVNFQAASAYLIAFCIIQVLCTPSVNDALNSARIGAGERDEGHTGLARRPRLPDCPYALAQKITCDNAVATDRAIISLRFPSRAYVTCRPKTETEHVDIKDAVINK